MVPIIQIMITLLPPAYVVRREGNVLTRVCPSVCPQGGMGGSVQPERGSVQPGGQGQSRWGGQSSRGGGGSVQPRGGGWVSPAGGGGQAGEGGGQPR